jgi:alkylhydroperoxidase family enzyme
MAQLLDEIQWGEPILPAVADPAWEAEIKRRGGRVFGVDRRVAPLPWLREACLGMTTYRPSEVSQRLFTLGAMVTAQENSCRYCYGANRAFLKILGYSESFISRLERDAHVAELDDRERGFIAFCRNLARSRPRPAKAERDALIKLGYAPLAVHEIAFLIAMGCFYNRIGVLTACPPELGFERLANGILGRVMGLAMPLMSRLTARRGAAQQGASIDAKSLASGPFGPVVATLAGLPAAAMMKAALDGAFASTVLARSTKALMFAIVARTLGCRHSEAEARKLLLSEHFDEAEIDAALATLASKRIPPHETGLLPWVRDTIHYQTAAVQNQTRALTADVGTAAMLEAIGVAALANATVRLAMLLE